MEYPNFKVCVRCFTFNQSEYITDAMNGFCMQETNFPFVCCIVDDASIDGEQEVLNKYVENNFNLAETSVSYKKETGYAFITYAQHKTNKNCYFAVLLLKENHYSTPSLKAQKMSYLNEWMSPCIYEAICEGDDYWIDNKKIQDQYDYLESHNDFSMCYTRCKRFCQTTGEFEKEPWGGENETFLEFVEGNTVPTLTSMIRIVDLRRYYNEIDPIPKRWKIGDYPMWLYLSREKKIKYIDRVTGVYRITNNSASHFNNSKDYISLIESSVSIALFFVSFFHVTISKDNFVRDRKSRMATNLLFQYNDRTAAIDVIRSIKNKRLIEYLKMLIFKNDILFYLYKKRLNY